jgi:copper homeostasis protein
MTPIYEACVTSVSQARAAARAGADRLELCARLLTGGVTPPEARIRAVLAAAGVPVHIMIRRTTDGFRCSPRLLDRMLADITAARHAGAHGLVLGVLDPDGGVDEATMRVLMDAAAGLSVTFHRAFDQTPDPFGALEALAALGVCRILTSGGAPTARQGAPRLRQLVAAARGRVRIVAAGTVRADHVAALVAETGVREVHAHLSTAREMAALARVVKGWGAGSREQ